MKKGDTVNITATENELKLIIPYQLSIDAILENRTATIHVLGKNESDVSTALGLWIIPNKYLEKI
jgi:hypothetical protein